MVLVRPSFLYRICVSVQFSSVQSLSRVWLFATPWTTALQASLSITNSQSPPKPMWLGRAFKLLSVLPSCLSLELQMLVFSSVQFSCSVVSDSLWPHESQHERPPCPSTTPGVYPNSCPLSRWCHLTISSSVIPSPPAFNLSQHQGLFKWVSSPHQVAKVLEFQLQYSNEYSGLISFRMDWLDLLAVQGTLKSSSTTQFKSISSALSFLYSPTFISVHDYWKKHSLD